MPVPGVADPCAGYPQQGSALDQAGGPVRHAGVRYTVESAFDSEGSEGAAWPACCDPGGDDSGVSHLAVSHATP